MQISPEDYTLIKEHLSKHWKGEKRCPICNERRWHIQAIVAPRIFEEEKNISIDHQENDDPIFPNINELDLLDTMPPPVDVVPIVTVVCMTCYFVHNFCLVPIKKEGTADGK